MCLRDDGGDLEVFMIHRVASMAFAPSTFVFPGGGVDERDGDGDLPWAGPPPAAWAALLDTDELSARTLVAAAVREVFEETGVLLAGPTPDTVAVASSEWAAARAALVARELSLAELLRRDGLRLRSDLLSYRAHWVTPTFEPRRFDTRFFAARMPAGQVADDATSEAQYAGWERPADLLASSAAGALRVLPPTIVCLEGLAAASSVEAYLGERPLVRAVQPELVEEDGRLVLRMDLP